MKGKNILVVWNSLNVLGGVEVFILNLCEQLKAEGFNITLLVFEDGKLREEFENIGVQIRIVKRRWKFDPLLLLDLVGIVKKENVQIIHGHEQFQGLISALVKLFCKVKVVNTFHIAAHEHETINKNPYIPKLTFWLSDHLVFVSKAVCDSYASLFANKNQHNNKLHVIHNGVPVEKIESLSKTAPDEKARLLEELGLKKEDIFVLTIGRLTEQKGQIFLLHAFKNILKDHPKLKLIIFGEGELENEFLQFISINNLEENIKIFKPRRDIYKVINLCDIFVFPSLWEGFSIVLLEVMSLAKPIVVTNATGVDEIAIDSYNSLICSTGDIPSLERNIDILLRREELNRDLSLNARKTVLNCFDLPEMGQKYIDLYVNN